ncbi:hypothetical protein GQ44DRAFT_720380 [Phaeosphaeriaceae sp. PMI808]|nr:hypothetical protein GQ44DRAFT_720380 [Phaeosphaeriaceae sp. PMI808]
MILLITFLITLISWTWRSITLIKSRDLYFLRVSCRVIPYSFNRGTIAANLQVSVTRRCWQSQVPSNPWILAALRCLLELQR